MAAQVVERVGVFRLDDDGEVKRQTVGDLDALVGRGDDGLGIVHAVLLAEGVELVFRVERFKQLIRDEAVGDEPLEMVVVAAEKTRVVVRAGDDEQLFIVLCALLQHAEQRVFGNVGALKGLKEKKPGLMIGLCGCMANQKHVVEKLRLGTSCCVHSSSGVT